MEQLAAEIDVARRESRRAREVKMPWDTARMQGMSHRSSTAACSAGEQECSKKEGAVCASLKPFRG